MRDKTIENQIPILKFLNKHKWRIILPVLFATFYFALPKFLQDYISVQQNLFIKSATLNKIELDREILNIRDEVLSDQFLSSLATESDLFKDVTSDKTDYLRKHIYIWIRGDHYKDETSVQIWVHFKGKDGITTSKIADSISARFENDSQLQVNKYATEPYYPVAAPTLQFVADIAVRGFFLFSIPLILFWEIPNMFYSAKTKEMIFEPLKSDWQDELLDAKLRNQKLKAIQINLYYSYAFLAAMLQKSPIGDLVEFINRLAK